MLLSCWYFCLSALPYFYFKSSDLLVCFLFVYIFFFLNFWFVMFSCFILSDCIIINVCLMFEFKQWLKMDTASSVTQSFNMCVLICMLYLILVFYRFYAVRTRITTRTFCCSEWVLVVSPFFFLFYPVGELSWPGAPVCKSLNGTFSSCPAMFQHIVYNT